MLDIGWAELFVIGIVLLVVVGPKDLPRVLYQAGQYAARARAMARDAYHGLQDMVEESEVDEEEVKSPKAIEVKTPAAPPIGDKQVANPDPLRVPHSVQTD